MENTKLIKILKTFSREDIKRFGDFVSSPFFNKIKNLISLFEAIKPFYPELSGEEFTKKNLFKIIFPGEPYSDERFRVLCSRLFALTVKFEAFRSITADELEIKINALKNMKQAEILNIFEYNLSAAGKLTACLNPKDESYFFRLYEITSLKNLSLGHFSKDKDIQAEADYLSVYYIVKLLKIYTTALNSRKSINIDLDIALADKVSSIIDIKKFSEYPLIKIHYNLFLLARDFGNAEYFFRHLELTEQFPDILSTMELYESYIILLNFCVLKIQNGNDEFKIHKFNIYKTILRKKLYLYQQGYLGYDIFNNMVNSALETGNCKWAEEFVQEYKDMLHENYKTDIVNLCNARINYYLKQFDRALGNLSHLNNIENPYYKFAVKDLTIKTFYEMGYYENIISIIDSYKHMLSKNRQVNKDIKKKRFDFLNSLNGLLKIKLNPDFKKADEFKNSLRISSAFPNKDWIAEKIEDILSD